MKCPRCNGTVYKTYDSKWVETRKLTYRRRHCTSCEHRFTTYEMYGDDISMNQAKIEPWGRREMTRIMPGEFVAQMTRPQYGRIMKASLIHDDLTDVATTAGYGSRTSIRKAQTNIWRDLEVLIETKGLEETAKLYRVEPHHVTTYLARRGNRPSKTTPEDAVAEVLRLSNVLDAYGDPIKIKEVVSRLSSMGYDYGSEFIYYWQRRLYAEGHPIPRLESRCQQRPGSYIGLITKRASNKSDIDGAPRVVSGAISRQKS